ncbi:WXG100 family type VII secretion target [Goodfellowiella coeruleoviolacea]|uniref:WXG100 family type VII secretion target n=1 Tax=Goodfellowiella coeruleoviolacea TaxID=334858 RepID=A0AAE3G9Y8_9PSEU|nr:WXG100 family type VII secretion target [Goodfellowiella coeruleoviolacea]MCP2163968.1 hypothetical protein [Goodfellowiella coeruleoviolacea]
MTNGYEVDPASLTAESAGFATQGDAVIDVRDRLVNALNAEGPCWGDDDTGQEFAAEYLPGVEQMVRAFTDLASGLVEVRNQLVGMAQQYEQVEQDQQRGFDHQRDLL